MKFAHLPNYEAPVDFNLELLGLQTAKLKKAFIQQNSLVVPKLCENNCTLPSSDLKIVQTAIFFN